MNKSLIFALFIIPFLQGCDPAIRYQATILEPTGPTLVGNSLEWDIERARLERKEAERAYLQCKAKREREKLFQAQLRLRSLEFQRAGERIDSATWRAEEELRRLEYGDSYINQLRRERDRLRREQENQEIQLERIRQETERMKRDAQRDRAAQKIIKREQMFNAQDDALRAAQQGRCAPYVPNAQELERKAMKEAIRRSEETARIERANREREAEREQRARCDEERARREAEREQRAICDEERARQEAERERRAICDEERARQEAEAARAREEARAAEQARRAQDDALRAAQQGRRAPYVPNAQELERKAMKEAIKRSRETAKKERKERELRKAQEAQQRALDGNALPCSPEEAKKLEERALKEAIERSKIEK